MKRLIVELKNEHNRIAKALNEVKTLGISTPEGQKLLIESKHTLLAHLQREDRDFYPVLRKAALLDTALNDTLEHFAKDMDLISKSALDFFEKYKSGGSGLDFARDFGRLFSTLQMRIGREERILYAEYLKLIS